MPNARGQYTIKPTTTSESRSLSEAAALLEITVQKCSRLVKKLSIPVRRIGYVVVIGPKEFEKLRASLQRNKKRAK